MNPLDLNAIVAAFGAHNWLVLVMFAAVYARFIFSDKSKFPATWNPNLLPIFSGVAGAVITTDATLQAGSGWGTALIAGFVGLVAAGVFDGLVTVIFGDPAKAPSWARFIVMVVDDLGKGGTPPAGGGGSVSRGNAVDAEASKLSPPAAHRRSLLLALGVFVLLAAIAVLCSGCLSSAPIVPETPANQAQIQSCQSTAALHNDLVIGDFVLTGGGATVGAVGALVNDVPTKNNLAITAAVLGGTALVASGLIAYTASNFQNGQCPSVVGPLPALPAAGAK